jgi:hypothetical protein
VIHNADFAPMRLFQELTNLVIARKHPHVSLVLGSHYEVHSCVQVGGKVLTDQGTYALAFCKYRRCKN